MGKIISIVNQKGGVGKSTTSLGLGAFLAAKGKKVLIVDLDHQANATSGLGVEFEKVRVSMYNVLIGSKLPHEAIKKTSILNLDILPSSPDLAGASIELVNMEKREWRLEAALSKLKSDYDYILIDSPPSLGILTINGLVAADEVIIPVQCEYYSLEGLTQLLKTIRLLRKHLRKELPIKGALLTMYDRRNRISQEVEKEMRRYFPGRVFEAVIPRSVRLAEAPSYGKTILQYDAESKGAKAYRQLAEEIIALDS